MTRLVRFVLALTVFAVATLLTQVVLPSARAQAARPEHRDRCSVRDLRGTFSVLATGTVITPPPGSGISAGPFATVGTLRVDEDGQAKLNGTRSFNGRIVTEVDLPGTITLESNCVGSAEFQGGRQFDLVVLDDQNEMHWIQTNPGAVVTIILKRL